MSMCLQWHRTHSFITGPSFSENDLVERSRWNWKQLEIESVINAFEWEKCFPLIGCEPSFLFCFEERLITCSSTPAFLTNRAWGFFTHVYTHVQFLLYLLLNATNISWRVCGVASDTPALYSRPQARSFFHVSKIDMKDQNSRGVKCCAGGVLTWQCRQVQKQNWNFCGSLILLCFASTSQSR